MNFMRGSKERWEELNPILEDGQPGFERPVPNSNSEESEYKLKIGDGIHHWIDLPYIGSSELFSILSEISALRERISIIEERLNND